MSPDKKTLDYKEGTPDLKLIVDEVGERIFVNCVEIDNLIKYSIKREAGQPAEVTLVFYANITN